MQAFHELEVCMGSCADLYEAKRGAAAGVFQAVVAGKEHVSCSYFPSEFTPYDCLYLYSNHVYHGKQELGCIGVY
jgi:hypothetical protein